MAEPKHTPAPWTYRIDDYQNNYFVFTATHQDIAEVFTNPKANAKLMAAAPDLLEALRELHDACEYWEDQDDPVLKNAREAIQKAQ